MLVITLKKTGDDNVCYIGGAKVRLLGTSCDGARIGIEAPMSVGVQRGSVFERHQRKQRDKSDHGSGPGHDAGA